MKKAAVIAGFAVLGFAVLVGFAPYESSLPTFDSAEYEARETVAPIRISLTIGQMEGLKLFGERGARAPSYLYPATLPGACGGSFGFPASGMEIARCPWLPADRPLYVDYHDTEWGVPSRDPRYLFEMICLEGAQAGLSWWTVLQKRERYREVFHGFDPMMVAKMTDTALERRVLDPGIIRHRGKIFSVRENAKAWLRIEDPVAWLWSFTGGETRENRFKTMADYPSKTPESDAMSKALRKAGFNFVGSTTLYAFMQAVGMVNDHSVDCFRK